MPRSRAARPSHGSFARAEGESPRAASRLAEKNLARAKNDQAFRAVERQFAELTEQQQKLEKEQANAKQRTDQKQSVRRLEQEAIAQIDRLAELADDASNQPHVVELFRRLDVKMYLKFGHIHKEKYVQSRIAGGVLTFGAAEPPIPVYSGPTSRTAVGKSAPESVEEGFPRHEKQMLGNVKQAKA